MVKRMLAQHLHLLALNGSPTGTLVADGRGTILFANPTAERLFGYGPGELNGVQVDTLLPNQRLDDMADIVERQVEGRRKDQTPMAVEIYVMSAPGTSEPTTVISVLDISERRILERRLERTRERYQAFERTIAEIAATFVATPFDRVDEVIVESQQRIVEVLHLDRSSLWQQSDTGEFRPTHLWERPDVPKVEGRSLNLAADLPWIYSEVSAGRTVSFSSIAEVPSETDRASLMSLGTQANVTVPLVADGRMLGIVTFGSARGEREWPADTLERLRLVAAVFAHTIARRDARRALEGALAEVGRLKEQLAIENVQLRREVRSLKPPRLVAAESLAARQVLAQIEQVAPTTATVLMMGETGSGKEVFAQVLHDLSPRHGKPMVRVNCAAIPTALIESELFGRERGAYTGALSRQIGRFEIADGSTIFLDEVGELPLEVQVKLLRVLQDRVIERLGSPHPVKVDVRIIAATNRDLEQAVASKAFREDLYYRLNVFPIHVPPLRERLEDIPALVWTFIDEFSKAFGKDIDSLSRDSLKALQSYGWPGNIRELRNVIEHAVIVSAGPKLTIAPPRSTPIARTKSQKLNDVEVDHIRNVLESTGWRVRGKGGAADVLGVKPTTLESRMAKLGIRRQSRPSA